MGLRGVRRCDCVTETLIIGDATDPHVDAVATTLARQASTVAVIDATTFTNSAYSLVEARLSVGRTDIDLGSGGAGWIRRLAPPLWGAGHQLGSVESARRGAAL